VQHFTLNPTGTRTVFAMGGAARIRAYKRDLKLRYNYADGVLQSEEPLVQPIDYEVVSSNILPPFQPPTPLQENARRTRLERPSGPPISKQITDYASRPDVSGVDSEGRPLATLRPRQYVTELDADIALNIERHLKDNFTYTLDLSDAAKLKRDEDPMVAFLYTLRRGHCEYFAGAMTLMCQSLGLQARLVNGFKCDEYNDLGEYYIIRQSHAHSWVEVLTTAGWRTFDPTTSREETRAEAGFWQSIKHFIDFIEFKYANSVIAYDNDHRENLIANVETRMQNSADAGTQWLFRLREWFNLNVYSVSSSVLGSIMALMILTIVAFVGWYVWERWMLRRRAVRIGLESLPASDQIRLVRQLGFYDELVKLLARHHITRPRHLTPLEFSQSLLYLPNQAYDTIRRLTEVFYRVRYGNAALSPGSQRRLSATIAQLEGAMGPSPKRA
jgi:hypothetical protein